MTKPYTDGIYARASAKVEAELWQFRGKVFTSQDMQRECGCKLVDTDTCNHKTFRDAVTRVLYEWSHNKKPRLRQVSRNGYEIVDRERIPLLWSEVEGTGQGLYFPRDKDTGMELPFAKSVILEDGDVIGLSGESNRGKSAICLNFAAENIDTRDVFLWLSEYHPLQLQRRLSYLPRDKYEYLATHTFKLDLANISEQIADDPDALHVLDWVNISDGFWKIADFDEAIQKSLRHGMAVVALQKIEGEDKGVGRDWGEFNTSLSMTLSKLDELYVKLKLIKVKSHTGINPSFKTYRFMIVEQGSRIASVDEIKDCKRCKGKGSKWTKSAGDVNCDSCDGKGYLVV